jgi:hypothetical protein
VNECCHKEKVTRIFVCKLEGILHNEVNSGFVLLT